MILKNNFLPFAWLDCDRTLFLLAPNAEYTVIAEKAERPTDTDTN